MWWGLERELKETSTRRISKVERRRQVAFEEWARRERRTTMRTEFTRLDKPWQWEVDSDFDPYSVRRRRARIARGLEHNLRGRRWRPHPPAGHRVKKKDGSLRVTSSFSIPDEVISGRLYRSLMRKNLPLLSAHSYAYRADLVTFDAIRHIRSHWQALSRVYVAEFDLEAYFDNVSHEYILRCLDELDVYRTPLEQSLVESFLTSRMPYLAPELALKTAQRVKGVPQGTSVSLFLANLALIPLDRRFESLGIQFSRYADDSLLWSDSYDSIVRAVDQIHLWCEASGVRINSKKSPGIRIVTTASAAPAEWSNTTNVTYLGHSIGLRSTDLAKAALDEMYRKVQQLIYRNLLEHPMKGTQDLTRLANGTDRDYVTLVSQLRRYLYGHHSENDVRRLGLGGFVPRDGLQGKISLFPEITTTESLQRFDEDVRAQIWLALKKRQRLLSNRLEGQAPKPWGMDKDTFDKVMVMSQVSQRRVDMRLPSAVRMHKVVKVAVQAHGPRVIGKASRLYRL